MAKAERLITADYNGLSNKPIINANLSEVSLVPVANTYYRHVGATTLTFTQGLIYKYDGTKFEEIGASAQPIDLSKYIQADTLTGLLPNVQYALVHDSDNVFTLVEVEGGGTGTGWFIATSDAEAEALLINDNLGKFFMFIGESVGELYSNYALYQIVQDGGHSTHGGDDPAIIAALVYISAEDIADALSDLEIALEGKQDTLVSGETIKTINGQSVLGEGNIAVKTYQPFPAGWTVNGTVDEFCVDVNADTSAIGGMAYLGDVIFSDLPFNGNADAVVEIIRGTSVGGKVIHIIITSGDRTPYRWEYTWWNNGLSTSGWKSWQETLVGSGQGQNIKTINHTSILGSGDIELATPSDLEGKQDTLVSGTNIKTINNQSILGEGNIDIQGGGGSSDYDDLNNIPIINQYEETVGGEPVITPAPENGKYYKRPDGDIYKYVDTLVPAHGAIFDIDQVVNNGDIIRFDTTKVDEFATYLGTLTYTGSGYQIATLVETDGDPLLFAVEIPLDTPIHAVCVGAMEEDRIVFVDSDTDGFTRGFTNLTDGKFTVKGLGGALTITAVNDTDPATWNGVIAERWYEQVGERFYTKIAVEKDLAIENVDASSPSFTPVSGKFYKNVGKTVPQSIEKFTADDTSWADLDKVYFNTFANVNAIFTALEEAETDPEVIEEGDGNSWYKSWALVSALDSEHPETSQPILVAEEFQEDEGAPVLKYLAFTIASEAPVWLNIDYSGLKAGWSATEGIIPEEAKEYLGSIGYLTPMNIWDSLISKSPINTIEKDSIYKYTHIYEAESVDAFDESTVVDNGTLIHFDTTKGQDLVDEISNYLGGLSTDSSLNFCSGSVFGVHCEVQSSEVYIALSDNDGVHAIYATATGTVNDVEFSAGWQNLDADGNFALVLTAQETVYNVNDVGSGLWNGNIIGIFHPEVDEELFDRVALKSDLGAGGVKDYNDLDNKPIINADLGSIEPVEGTYYKHIGETDSTFTHGIIYLYNDNQEFKAINGEGGGSGSGLPDETNAEDGDVVKFKVTPAKYQAPSDIETFEYLSALYAKLDSAPDFSNMVFDDTSYESSMGVYVCKMLSGSASIQGTTGTLDLVAFEYAGAYIVMMAFDGTPLSFCYASQEIEEGGIPAGWSPVYTDLGNGYANLLIDENQTSFDIISVASVSQQSLWNNCIGKSYPFELVTPETREAVWDKPYPEVTINEQALTSLCEEYPLQYLWKHDVKVDRNGQLYFNEDASATDITTLAGYNLALNIVEKDSNTAINLICVAFTQATADNDGGNYPVVFKLSDWYNDEWNTITPIYAPIADTFTIGTFTDVSFAQGWQNTNSCTWSGQDDDVYVEKIHGDFALIVSVYGSVVTTIDDFFYGEVRNQRTGWKSLKTINGESLFGNEDIEVPAPVHLYNHHIKISGGDGDRLVLVFLDVTTADPSSYYDMDSLITANIGTADTMATGYFMTKDGEYFPVYAVNFNTNTYTFSYLEITGVTDYQISSANSFFVTDNTTTIL